MCLHSGIDTDECAAHGDWAGRVEDHAYPCEDPSLRDLIGRAECSHRLPAAARELRALRTSRRTARPAVTAALPDEGLTAADLETCCYGPDTEILGDSDAAAVLTVKEPAGLAAAWLVPSSCILTTRRGRGRALVAEERGAGGGRCVDMHLGTAFPRYVWPGVDFRYTAALALFEATGFEPYGAACNMAIPTTFRADSPAGVVVEREGGDGAAALASRSFPHWLDEVERAAVAGTCYAARGRTPSASATPVN
jgi:hypothetical protein